MAGAKFVFVMVLCMMVAGAPLAQAGISCGTVDGKLVGCMTYLKGSVLNPSSSCCQGIATLNKLASSTPDRRAACECLKAAARSITGINYGLAAGLPRKCGVSIPYKISPSTNCNTVT